MRYKKFAETKVTQVERHTNHFEQTMKLFKCEEKVNYLCMISVLGRQSEFFSYKSVNS